MFIKNVLHIFLFRKKKNSILTHKMDEEENLIKSECRFVDNEKIK